MANGNPSPGWYQDPRDPSQVRWWDGGGWTQNTQPMPGTAPQATPVSPVAETPAPEQPGEPQWGQTAQPEQPQWGQTAQSEQPQPGVEPQWGQTAQTEQPQWGQQGQPEQPQWGQQGQPEQPQWGQQAQPGAEQQWGQQAQPGIEPQWGQQGQPEQPQWGQQAQPGVQQQWGQQGQPGVEQQWGQQAQQPWPQTPQPGAEGGWQQQPQQGAWGSAVPPAAVPGGLAPGSPMGQTNVFPTAETIDPITGMPVTTPDGKSKTSGKRLAALVGATLLVGLLILGLLWFFLFRGSSDQGAGTTGSVEVTATFSGTVDPACADLGAALTADDLSTTVANRLNDVAIAKDLEENQAYFEQLSKDIKPIMDQYQSACIAAVSAGNAPEFYRTFVETFDASVADGASVAGAALQDGGQVPTEDADRLRAEASKLQASAAAVITISGGPSPSASATTPSVSPEPSASVTTSPAPAETVVPSPIG